MTLTREQVEVYCRIFDRRETDMRRSYYDPCNCAEPEGPWYYEPSDYDGDCAWSEGFATRADAIEAAQGDLLLWAHERHPPTMK